MTQRCSAKPVKTRKNGLHNMIACTVHFSENHTTPPLPVTSKFPQNIASVPTPEQKCIAANQISRFNEKH